MYVRAVLAAAADAIAGTIKHVSNAKIAVFVNGIDIPKPENKATVLIKTAEQLKKFSKEEEQEMEGVSVFFFLVS
jgi:chaperonin GroEL (HSP60 family)